MDINKLKKRKVKYRSEGNLSSTYFCCKELAELYFRMERYDDAIREYMEMKQISVDSDNKLDVGKADRMIGEMYCEKGEFSKAISHQKNHLSISCNENDNVEEQRALATLGRTYFLLAESILDSSSEQRSTFLNEAKKFYMKGLEICHELTEENISNKQRMEMECRLFLNIGLVLDCQNQHDDAINYMLKAVSICKKLDLWEDLYRTYSALGSIYQKHGNRQDALRIYELAIDVAECLSNKEQLESEILLQKADVLLDLPDIRGARQALLRAYKLDPPNQLLKEEIERKLRTVAAMCIFENKLTELPPDSCYEERKELYENMGDAASSLNNYSLALSYYHLMLEAVEKCGNKKKDLIETYVSLAQTYKDNNQLSNALKYFQKELDLEEHNSPEACKTLMNIAEINHLLGNTHEMFEAYTKAKATISEFDEVKLKKTVLSSLHNALISANRISEAEEIKREFSNIKLDVLIESSDDEEEINHQFGLNICIDNISDEESSTAAKKLKLSRTRNKQKGNLERKNEKGETPLHVAAINGNASLAKRLIEQGHRVDVKDYSGWTPLHEACNHGHIDVVQILLDNRAPINDRGGAHCDGVTPLLDAASNGSLDVMELLLSHGASALMRTNKGETVLDCLSSWRERRFEEVGVDLDPVTRAHYDIIYNNLKQVLEKAGQKIPVKHNTENKSLALNENIMSFSTKRVSSHSLKNSSKAISQQSQEKNESATEDYKITMNSFRRKKSYETMMPSKTNKTLFSALLPEDEIVGDDWLEEDIDVHRPNKRQKTERSLWSNKNKENICKNKKNAFTSIYNSDDEESVDAEYLNLIEDSSSDADHSSQVCSEIDDLSSVDVSIHKKNFFQKENPREKFKEMTNLRKKQVTLLSSGVIKEKVPKTISNMNLLASSNESSSVSQHPCFSCIKVRIEDKTIVVPIQQDSYDSLSISWLAKEAAERYRRLEGTEPLLRLEMEDGGLLTGSDPLAILMGVSQIQACVLSWKAVSLTGLYKEACDNANSHVHADLNNILEACQATGSALFDYMYLEHQMLSPVLTALSHYPSLQFLSIAGTNISDTFITDLAECITKITQLRSLDLSNINITLKGLEALCQVVKRQNSLQRLEKLKLGYNPLGDCMRPLAELVSLIPRLRYLAIPSVGITSRSFNTFIHFTLECLEVLDLSYNEIGGEGMTDVLGRLEAQTIVELRLCSTGSQTVREIGFYLQHNTPLSLRVLDLSYCPTTQLEVDCLIKGINMCKHIEKLILDGLGNASVNINDLTVNELSACGTKANIGATLPHLLKKFSLTSPQQDYFPMNKGPFGLCTLTN